MCPAECDAGRGIRYLPRCRHYSSAAALVAVEVARVSAPQGRFQMDSVFAVAVFAALAAVAAAAEAGLPGSSVRRQTLIDSPAQKQTRALHLRGKSHKGSKQA